MKSRWAVEVEGQQITVARLETYLAHSIRRETDTFISRLRDVPVLRTILWDGVDDSAIVEQLAQTELALLQGLTKLAGGDSPLAVGTIFELGAGDAIIRQTRTSINCIRVVSIPTDPPPLFQQRLEVVRQHDALAGAVVELSGESNWISIYKAVEYLEEHFGGEKNLATNFPNKKAALKRIKRTAQSVRHRARAFKSIARPFNLVKADEFLKNLLKDIFFEIAPPQSNLTHSNYVIQSRDYPPEQIVGLKSLSMANDQERGVALEGDALSAV